MTLFQKIRLPSFLLMLASGTICALTYPTGTQGVWVVVSGVLGFCFEMVTYSKDPDRVPVDANQISTWRSVQFGCGLVVMSILLLAAYGLSMMLFGGHSGLEYFVFGVLSFLLGCDLGNWALLILGIERGPLGTSGKGRRSAK